MLWASHFWGAAAMFHENISVIFWITFYYLLDLLGGGGGGGGTRAPPDRLSKPDDTKLSVKGDEKAKKEVRKDVVLCQVCATGNVLDTVLPNVTKSAAQAQLP